MQQTKLALVVELCGAVCDVERRLAAARPRRKFERLMRDHHRVAVRQTRDAVDVGVMLVRFGPARGRVDRALRQSLLAPTLRHRGDVGNRREERRRHHPPFLYRPAILVVLAVVAPRALLLQDRGPVNASGAANERTNPASAATDGARGSPGRRPTRGRAPGRRRRSSSHSSALLRGARAPAPEAAGRKRTSPPLLRLDMATSLGRALFAGACQRCREERRQQEDSRGGSQTAGAARRRRRRWSDSCKR